MPEHDGINVTEMLIGIKEDVAKISAKLEHLGDTDSKADAAYTLSKQNEADIKDLKSNSQWWSRTMWVAIILPVALFIVENFLMK